MCSQGGGGLLGLVLIIVSDVVSLKDRGKYQGITEATILIGNACGPLIGAAFAESDWRWGESRIEQPGEEFNANSTSSQRSGSICPFLLRP